MRKLARDIFKLRIEKHIEAIFVGLIMVVGLMQFQNCSAVSFSSSGPNERVTSCTNPALCTCNPNSQTFNQPPATTTNKVDILLVLHDTGSFASSAATDVSNGLQQFVMNLPAGSDYRISTISALDPYENANAGQVYGPVFTTATVTPAGIANSIQHPTTGTNHGEYGLEALKAALTTQLTYNIGAGSLRQGAALAVFFMANEGDICELPATDPGTDDDWAAEHAEALTNCVGQSQASTIAAIQNYAHSNMMSNYVVGGITFTDMAIRDANGVEREYGWGYNSLVQTLNGPLVDLNSGSTAIANGLGAVGTLVGKLFNVKTDFVLSPSKGSAIDPTSIVVTVDGVTVPNTDLSFTTSNNDVHISDPAVAGHANSVVNINYCAQ